MTFRTPRLRWPSALLLAALLLPLLGGVLGGVATAFETPAPEHPCAAATPVPEPIRPPADRPPADGPPCGAVVPLSCCNEKASVTSAGEATPAASTVLLPLFLAMDAAPPSVAFRSAVAFVAAAPARAAPPPFLDTIVLRN